MRRHSLARVLGGLVASGVADADVVERARVHLDARDGDRAPVLVTVLLGLGAWVAAGCAVGVLAAADVLGDEGGPWLAWGLLFLGVALLLSFGVRKLPRPATFLRQLRLALALAGDALVVAGAGEVTDGFLGAAAAAFVLAAVTLRLLDDDAHRFSIALGAWSLVQAWLLDDLDAGELALALAALALVQVAIIGLLLPPRPGRGLLTSTGHATTVALISTLLAPTFDHEVSLGWWLPVAVVLTAGLLVLVRRVHGGEGTSKALHAAMAGMLLLGALGAFGNPGFLAALGILVLGQARGSLGLSILGGVALPGFLVAYYYGLDVPLAHEWWIVGGTGAVLLVARALLQRWDVAVSEGREAS